MSEMQPHQWPLSMRPKAIPASAAPSMVPGKSRRATEKQRQFARELGLDVPDDVTAAQISVLIDAALDKQREATAAEVLPDGKIEPWLLALRDAEPGGMAAELDRRGIKAVLLSWSNDESGQCDLACSGMTIAEAKQYLAAIGHKILRETDPNYDEMYRSVEAPDD